MCGNASLVQLCFPFSSGLHATIRCAVMWYNRSSVHCYSTILECGKIATTMFCFHPLEVTPRMKRQACFSWRAKTFRWQIPASATMQGATSSPDGFPTDLEVCNAAFHHVIASQPLGGAGYSCCSVLRCGGHINANVLLTRMSSEECTTYGLVDDLTRSGTYVRADCATSMSTRNLIVTGLVVRTVLLSHERPMQWNYTPFAPLYEPTPPSIGGYHPSEQRTPQSFLSMGGEKIDWDQ